MGVHNKTIQVDGESYALNQFTSTRGLKVLTKLTRLLGVSMSRFVDGLDGDVGAVIPLAVQALVERLDEDEVVALVRQDLMSCVFYQNQPLSGDIFEIHFQGRMGSMFKLCAEVVRFNYEDFLGVLAAAGKREAVAKTKKK